MNSMPTGATEGTEDGVEMTTAAPIADTSSSSQDLGKGDTKAKGSHVPAKKKKKRKKPKDMPARPLSAYNIFFREKRRKVIENFYQVSTEEDSSDRPDSSFKADISQPISFKEMAKVVGKQWHDVTEEEMKRFKELAQRDMERYAREMEAYRKNSTMQPKRGSSDQPIIPTAMTESKALPAAEEVCTAVSVTADEARSSSSSGERNCRSSDSSEVGTPDDGTLSASSQRSYQCQTDSSSNRAEKRESSMAPHSSMDDTRVAEITNCSNHSILPLNGGERSSPRQRDNASILFRRSDTDAPHLQKQHSTATARLGATKNKLVSTTKLLSQQAKFRRVEPDCEIRHESLALASLLSLGGERTVQSFQTPSIGSDMRRGGSLTGTRAAFTTAGQDGGSHFPYQEAAHIDVDLQSPGMTLLRRENISLPLPLSLRIGQIDPNEAQSYSISTDSVLLSDLHLLRGRNDILRALLVQKEQQNQLLLDEIRQALKRREERASLFALLSANPFLHSGTDASLPAFFSSVLQSHR